VADEVVVLTGIKETLDSLKKFDKDAVKNFNKVINSALTDAERSARGFVKADPPMSGWRKTDALAPRSRGGRGWPAYHQGIIQQGIRKSKVQGKVRGDYTTSAGALVNKSAAGAIIEVAGRKTQGRGTGRSFIRSLTDEIKNPSRLVWQAVDAKRSEVQRKVVGALDDAKKILQRNLDRERV
jgi:uncharacterized protein YfaP (DUF2135 family)